MNPHSGRFGSPPLPSWVEEFRPHQITAINQIVDLFRDYKVVFLDAPTGSGKTLIAEAVRRLLQQRTVYLCSSLTLQDQFVKDYPYAQLLKGRSNYPTLDKPELFNAKGMRRITCGECTKEPLFLHACPTCQWAPANRGMANDESDYNKEWTHCDHCHPIQECPYKLAKGDALHGELSVINTTYFLTETNYVGEFGAQYRDGQLVRWTHPTVVIDEADVLEEELMRFVEFVLPAKRMRQLDIGWPHTRRGESQRAMGSGDPDVWMKWAEEEALPKLERAYKEAAAVVQKFRDMNESPPADALKERNRLGTLWTGLLGIHDKLGDGWVYTGYEQGEESRYAAVKFKPVVVRDAAPMALWRHGQRFLLMSATIISPEQMAYDLGLEDHEWASVTVPSSFDPERRPVYVMPRASMSAKRKDQEFPKMRDAIEEVLARHPDERILIHTVSYALSKYLKGNVRAPRDIFSYDSSLTRASALAQFRRTENAVLLAPSFERGVDLPDEECRVVVVAKVPFPYLGDKQVSTRLYMPMGQQWYTTQTIRTLVQMTGRAMRHERDRCSIYVLDGMFRKRLWSRHRTLIPEWWREAIVWTP